MWVKFSILLALGAHAIFATPIGGHDKSGGGDMPMMNVKQDNKKEGDDCKHEDKWKWSPPLPCRVENSSRAVVQEHRCPYDFQCVVGPVDVTFNTTSMRFFYCAMPGKFMLFHSCKVQDVDSGKVVKTQQCPSGDDCTHGPIMVQSNNTNMMAYYCAGLKSMTKEKIEKKGAVTRACRVENAYGTDLLQRYCPDNFTCTKGPYPSVYQHKNVSSFFCEEKKKAWAWTLKETVHHLLEKGYESTLILKVMKHMVENGKEVDPQKLVEYVKSKAESKDDNSWEMLHHMHHLLMMGMEPDMDGKDMKDMMGDKKEDKGGDLKDIMHKLQHLSWMAKDDDMKKDDDNSDMKEALYMWMKMMKGGDDDDDDKKAKCESSGPGGNVMDMMKKMKEMMEKKSEKDQKEELHKKMMHFMMEMMGKKNEDDDKDGFLHKLMYMMKEMKEKKEKCDEKDGPLQKLMNLMKEMKEKKDEEDRKDDPLHKLMYMMKEMKDKKENKEDKDDLLHKLMYMMKEMKDKKDDKEDKEDFLHKLMYMMKEMKDKKDDKEDKDDFLHKLMDMMKDKKDDKEDKDDFLPKLMYMMKEMKEKKEKEEQMKEFLHHLMYLIKDKKDDKEDKKKDFMEHLMYMMKEMKEKKDKGGDDDDKTVFHHIIFGDDKGKDQPDWADVWHWMNKAKMMGHMPPMGNMYGGRGMW